MANLSDLVALDNGINTKLVTRGGKTGHSALVSEGEEAMISVGPGNRIPPGTGKLGSLARTKVAERNWSYGGAEVNIPNLNKSILQAYGPTEWNVLTNSCVSHVSKALWSVGVPNVYIPFVGAIHPSFLHIQMVVRGIGIYSSSYMQSF